MGVYGCSQVRPLGLFAVLTRNRQSALGLSRRTLRARETEPNAYNTSSTTTVRYQTIGDTNKELYI